MAREFNPPPGWPVPPEGWRPPPDWHPDPAWPAAPDGWVFWAEQEPEEKKPRFSRAYLAGAIVVALIVIGTLGNALGSSKPDGAVTLSTSPSSTSEATLVGALPEATASPVAAATTARSPATTAPTSRPAKTHVKTVVKPAVKKPAVKKPTKSKAPTRTTKPVVPARRTVTPGAFCKDADKGDVGFSKTGNRYVCSYYPSSDRYRWKRA
jgi:hypothetical protein